MQTVISGYKVSESTRLCSTSNGCGYHLQSAARTASRSLQLLRCPLSQLNSRTSRHTLSGLVSATGTSKDHFVGSIIADPGQRYAVVVARFNELVTRLLLAGALDAFARHQVSQDCIEVVWVPGAYELPVVASALARSNKFAAIVCIGTVVRGATTHYEAVAGGASNGILDVSRSTGIPTIFGVLTTENMEQALDRAGGKTGNKGAEAAVTAIEMANVMRALRSADLAADPWGVE